MYFGEAFPHALVRDWRETANRDSYSCITDGCSLDQCYIEYHAANDAKKKKKKCSVFLNPEYGN